jgi:hypothetical protein
MPTSLIVNREDEFANDHSVTNVAIRSRGGFTITDEPGHQAFMNSAYIADRVPNKFFAALPSQSDRLAFVTDGSAHTIVGKHLAISICLRTCTAFW